MTSAGLCHFAEIDAVSDSDWQRVLAVNLTGDVLLLPGRCVRYGRCTLGPDHRPSRLPARAARLCQGSALSRAAKGGVMALTRSLALAYAPHGITVNTIPPSGIETPMQHAGQAAGHLPPNDTMSRTIPLGHLGTSHDVAEAAAFLASDGAGYITGQVLGVNGGQVLA